MTSDQRTSVSALAAHNDHAPQRYYLEVVRGGDRIKDTAGELHSSLGSALKAAMLTARELVIEAVRSFDMIDNDRIEVRAENGEIVGTVSFPDILSADGGRTLVGLVRPMPRSDTDEDLRSNNQILATLPEGSRRHLLSEAEKVDLPLRMTLIEPNVDTPFVFFPESGLASVVIEKLGEGAQLEVGVIGFEGMAGTHVLTGIDRTPVRTFMQVAGRGWRVPKHALLDAMESDVVLRGHLLRYVHAFQLQLAHLAFANGRCKVVERLARWLLMSDDRIGNEPIELTHDFLSMMLGVRRSSVTDMIHVLEGEQAVRADRAQITIRDRSKLERIAGDAYGVPELEYEAIFGPFRKSRTSSDRALAGRRVLVVEDDFDHAIQMKALLTSIGAQVVGPSPTLSDAMRRLLEAPTINAAVVDVNLRGEMAFPLAEALKERAIPFIFVSGYGRDLVPEGLTDVAFYNKPVSSRDLTGGLTAASW